MPCQRIGNAIVCTARNGKKYAPLCECNREARLLCDWITNRETGETCSAPVCSKCAETVGKDKHLCTQHARAWQNHPKNKGGLL